jgi:hypothetical protein
MIECWRDSDGLVHILDDKYHVMLCEGTYRLGRDRLRFETPTCFQCITRELELASDPFFHGNGEPGIVEWKTTKR